MMSSNDLEALLDFVPDAILMLSPSGTVLKGNRSARRLLGPDIVGRDLGDRLSSSKEEFRIYLRRCSGSSAPLLSSILIKNADGTSTKMRIHGARLKGEGEPLRIALRCCFVDSDEFSVLAKKVRELNAEIHERRRAQAIVEETLRGNELLMRELHHRVKNNIQLMIGLFSTAQRETNSLELKEFLQAANQRLVALGTAQQLMYQSMEMEVVSARAFIAALSETIGKTLGPQVRLDVAAADGLLSTEMAFPLALILNELLTNAFKHGLGGGSGTIGVELRRGGEDFLLVVQDSGPGFVAGAPSRRSSGLGLVRGLCRQIGGALEVDNFNGARCTIRFSDRINRGEDM